MSYEPTLLEATARSRPLGIRAGQLLAVDHYTGQTWTARRVIPRKAIVGARSFGVRLVTPREAAERGLKPPRFPGKPIRLAALATLHQKDQEQSRRDAEERFFAAVPALKALGLVR